MANQVVSLAYYVFRDFYVQHADLDKLLTEEVLNANDITVVSRHPITYSYHN